jgi:hypothetical protein
VLLKFWLHISKAEQKKRFRKCLADPLLKWKITKEYRRHHAHYAAWVKAIEEMLAKTSTPQAPWIIVEANDIHWARVRVFETLVERVEAELARRQSQPALVSRTAAAAGATVKARAQRAAKDAHLANAEKQTTLAAEAGHGASRKPKAERAHA